MDHLKHRSFKSLKLVLATHLDYESKKWKESESKQAPQMCLSKLAHTWGTCRLYFRRHWPTLCPNLRPKMSLYSSHHTQKSDHKAGRRQSNCVASHVFLRSADWSIAPAHFRKARGPKNEAMATIEDRYEYKTNEMPAMACRKWGHPQRFTSDSLQLTAFQSCVCVPSKIPKKKNPQAIHSKTLKLISHIKALLQLQEVLVMKQNQPQPLQNSIRSQLLPILPLQKLCLS